MNDVDITIKAKKIHHDKVKITLEIVDMVENGIVEYCKKHPKNEVRIYDRNPYIRIYDFHISCPDCYHDVAEKIAKEVL